MHFFTNFYLKKVVFVTLNRKGENETLTTFGTEKIKLLYQL
jgi:hypothetical protein